MTKLGERLDEAEQKNDEAEVEDLSKQMEELVEKVGPEYANLINGTQDMDPNSEEGQDITLASKVSRSSVESKIAVGRSSRAPATMHWRRVRAVFLHRRWILQRAALSCLELEAARPASGVNRASLTTQEHRRALTWLSIPLPFQKNTPSRRAIQRIGEITAIPILNELHHHYVRI